MARVLVVDDHASNRALITSLLRYRRHEALEAADGIEALAQVRAAKPDLVICDILMPTMDGYEFVRQLRADAAIAHTEVIFYTATFLEHEARTLAKSCGVRQVLLKPCEPEQVLHAIDVALAQPGVREAPSIEGFERDHRRLLADKLVQKADQLELANRRLSALTELNLQLASERDPAALLDKVCRGARELLGARYAVLGVKDALHAVLTHVTTSGMADGQAQRIRQLRMDVGVPRQVMLDRTPRRFYNPGGDPLAVGLSGDYPQVHSGLIAPIVSLTQAYGWIFLIDKLGADTFSDDDERILAIHAAQAGRIYENGSLYLEMRRNADKLEAEITERRAAADKLRESELRFRQVAENIHEVFFLVSRDSKQTLYISPAYEQIWGRSCASLYADPLSWLASIHPDDVAAVRGDLGGRDGSSAFSSEYRIVRPDGGIRWISARGFPIHDANGAVYRMAGIAEDITERVQLTSELREREAGLSRAQVLAKLAHVITRPDGSFESWSATLPQLIGVEADNMPGSTREWLTLLHPDDRSLVRDASIRAAQVGQAVGVDYRLRHSGSEWRDLHQDIEPLSGSADASGKMRWFSTLQDITDRKRAEARVARLNRVYAVLSGINTLIVRVRDRDELFREACRLLVEAGAFTMAWIGSIDRATGDGTVVASHGVDADFAATVQFSARADAAGSERPESRAVRQLKPVISNDVDADPALATMHERLQARGLRAKACFPLVVGQKACGVLSLYAAETDPFDDEEVSLLLELAGDISFALDHIEKEEKLNYLAYYDALTGLANASLLGERLQQAIVAAGAGSGAQRLALAMIDIERFKTVNDGFGRHAGDALLRQVAQRLVQGFGVRAQVARVGADHFAVIVADAHDEAGVGRLFAAQYRQHFEPPFEVGSGELRMGARIGIALYPNDGREAETLYRNAEAAVKKAKASPERILFYDPRMTEAVAGRLAMETQLRRALEREEYVLHYQPKVELGSRRIAGVEALVRWNSPELGLVPPLRFISLLEETGLIVEVGLWVLRRAALDHAAWRAQGLAAPRIAVNVSAVQLREPDFVASVQAVLEQGVAPHGIDLELTESLIMEDIEANIGKLKALHALDVALAIDDFGTGYSSLAYLAKLPAQTLKIDRAFVMTMLEDPDNTTLVSTMISLAHSMRMGVVAEGVETEEQAKMLRLLRCDQMQGFLVSRPVPFEQMSRLLRAQSA